MSHPLLGCWAKIARAQEHFDTLKRDIRDFRHPQTDPVTIEIKLEASKYIARAKIVRPVPKTELGFLIGDCVHNARSALDHLAWGLAEWYSGEDPNDTATQFPIFFDQSLFERFGRRTIARVPQFVQAFFESAQPFTRPDPLHDPLWLLHNLDITDKHKIIPVTVYLPTHITISNMPVPVVGHAFWPGPLENGTEVGWIEVAQPMDALAEAEMKMRPRLDVDIAFRPTPNSGYLLVLPTLTGILKAVEEVAREFDALLTRHYGIPPAEGYDLGQ